MSDSDHARSRSLPTIDQISDELVPDAISINSPYFLGGYYTISAALRSVASRNAVCDWAILAEIMDFHFEPSNVAEPFSPKAIFSDRRTLVPNDLTDVQLDQLSEYVIGLNNHLIVARAGDVLWIRRRDVKAARRAVEAYLSAGIECEDPNHWTTCFKLYERGIRLARQIEPKGELPRRLLGHLEDRVRHYDGNDPLYLSLRMMNLLEEVRFGNFAVLAEIAGRIAIKSEQAGDFRRAQEHYATQSRLLKRADNRDAAEAALCARAQTFVSEAESQERVGSFMAAHKFWEDAVQAFQERPSLRTRLPYLRRRLAEAGKGLLGEMKKVRSDPVDLIETVNAVQAVFRGLPRQDAVFQLVLIEGLIDPVKLREQTLDFLRETPLQSIIKADMFDQAGRKIAVRPALGSGDPKVEEAAIEGFIDKNARFRRGLIAQAVLAPAMRVMRDEHDLGTMIFPSSLRTANLFRPADLACLLEDLKQGSNSISRQRFICLSRRPRTRCGTCLKAKVSLRAILALTVLRKFGASRGASVIQRRRRCWAQSVSTNFVPFLLVALGQIFGISLPTG